MTHHDNVIPARERDVSAVGHSEEEGVAGVSSADNETSSSVPDSPPSGATTEHDASRNGSRRLPDIETVRRYKQLCATMPPEEARAQALREYDARMNGSSGS